MTSAQVSVVSPLRVLVLADSRAFHTERYVPELRRQGCRVLVASMERGNLHHFHLKHRGVIRQLHYALAAPQVRRIVRRFRPDIINPHFASGYGFLAAASKARPPVLLHLWGSDILVVPHKSAMHRWKTRWALRRADYLASDSAYLLQAARDVASLSQSRIIAWGIEERFLAWHKSDYRLHKPLQIIVPRRQERIYNNIFTLRALTPLIQEGLVEVTYPDYGSQAGEFTRTASSLTDHGVHTYSCMPRDAFLRFLAGFDVYLSSALSDSSPASLIEAMGLGLIPVAADIPGVREWLHEGTGFTFENFSAESLRNTIRQVIERDDDHAAMRRRNFEKVKSEAVFENNITATIAIMRQLAGPEGGGR